MSAVPPTYSPTYSFSGLSQLPIQSVGLPGSELDAEFARLSESVNETISRLSEIQRDDGAVRNGVVGVPSLSSEVLSMISMNGTSLRTWMPLAVYAEGDMVGNPPGLEMLKIEQIDTDSVAGFPDLPIVIVPDVVWKWQIGDPESMGPCYRVYTDYEYQEGPLRWYCDVYSDTNKYYGWRGPIAVISEPDTLCPWLFSPDQWEPVFGSASGGLSMFPSGATTKGTYVCITPHTASFDFDDDLSTKWMLVAAPPEAGDLVVDTFTGTGAQTEFTLSVTPYNEANVQVFVDGLYQPKSAFLLSGTTLIFTSAPANAAAIEVVSGIPVQRQVVTVEDGGVTEQKIAAGAVTESKVASNSITASKLALNSVTSEKILDGAVGGSKIEAFSITGSHLAAGAVTAGKLSSYCVTEGNIAAGAVTASKILNGAVTPNKLPAGPLQLNGEPAAATDAATKGYVDTEISEAAAAKLDKTGGTVTGALAVSGAVTIGGALTVGTAAMAVPTGSDPICGVRGWVSFNSKKNSSGGADTANTARFINAKSSNISAVTKLATGKYRVDFASALPSVNYMTIVTGSSHDGGQTSHVGFEGATSATLATNKTTTSCIIGFIQPGGGLADPESGNFAIIY